MQPQFYLNCNGTEIASIQHPFEVSGRLDPPDRLHEAVSDNDADVSSGVALSLFAQHDKVLLLQAVGCGAQVQFKHVRASVRLRQRDVNALFKSWKEKKIISRSCLKHILKLNVHMSNKAVSNLLLMAESSVQGIFVAPRTRIPSLSTPTPE